MPSDPLQKKSPSPALDIKIPTIVISGSYLRKGRSTFMKEYIQIANKERFRSLFSGEMPTKATVIYHFIPIRMVEIKKTDHTKCWQVYERTGLSYTTAGYIHWYVTCLLRNLYACQEATVRTRHGTTDWFHIWKGVRQGCISSPCLFNLYVKYIMRNTRQDKYQLESRWQR